MKSTAFSIYDTRHKLNATILAVGAPCGSAQALSKSGAVNLRRGN